jgi:hypothetical protein
MDSLNHRTTDFEQRFCQFKNQYKNFVKQHQTEIVDDFKKDFKKLKHGYQFIQSLLIDLNKKEASEFNIFSILERDRYEVRTHTPFLAELLDSKGTHGQRNLFLSTFLTKLLGYLDGEAIHPDWYVIKESEYIDLRLVNYSLGEAVYIENKIDSDAHSGQLSRYFKKWKEGFSKGRGAFIYLTPNGTNPGKDGFDEKIYQRKLVINELKPFSYRENIVGWLESTFQQIQAPRVQQTIKQYIDLIKTL